MERVFMQISGKRGVVTGSSVGIGPGIANGLAASLMVECIAHEPSWRAFGLPMAHDDDEDAAARRLVKGGQDPILLNTPSVDATFRKANKGSSSESEEVFPVICS